MTRGQGPAGICRSPWLGHLGRNVVQEQCPKSAPMNLRWRVPLVATTTESRSEPSGAGRPRAQPGGGAAAGGPWPGRPGPHSRAARVRQSGARCRTSPPRGRGWSCEAWRSSPTTACRCWPTPRPGMACAAVCSTSRPRRTVSALLQPRPGLGPRGSSQGLLLSTALEPPRCSPKEKGESRAPSFLLSLWFAEE